MTLAIISTIIAVVALTLTLRREWLDRPALQVQGDPIVSPSGLAEIVLTVTNNGRQPTTVGPVGFEWAVTSEEMPPRPQGEVLLTDPWDRHRIEPGGHWQLRWGVPAKPYVHLNAPVRFFARHGRRDSAYSRPMAFFRALLDMGWSTSADQAMRGDEVWEALPVAPRWKLWLPREQRAKTKVLPVSGIAEQTAAARQRVAEEGVTDSK